MTAIALRGAIELGLIYSLVAAGLFISYKILNLADLTVDGSFTLGAAASIMLTIGGHPWLGLLAAILAGALAGFFTAFLQTKLRIQSILAGILTMTGLYSINLKVMDNKASANSINQPNIFDWFKAGFGDYGKLVFILILVVICAAILVLFLGTQLGLSIRATGDNENMVRSSSINVGMMKTIGLVIANALVGLSGAVLAQYQQATDAGMGIGVVVTGLASLIIGEVLIGNLIQAVFHKRNILTGLISVLLGSVIYRIIIAFVLQHNNAPALQFLNITASDMKLLSSIIVIVAISYPAVRDSIQLSRLKRSQNYADHQ
ncbi:ABC transporter permease [Scatolibacter rhodanostii]|uniref:ABC transporter permease n=1 Tax=Scatolibacter rhodanostii TaxID=2014781 RepID=UPI000C078F2B|nr:ABC transporter permease [Scatolibacter rhodanostii]